MKHKKGLRRTPKVFASSYQPPQRTPSFRIAPTLTPVFRVIGLVVILLLITRLPVFRIKTVSVTGSTNQELVSELQNLEGQSLFSGKVNRTIQHQLVRDGSLADLTCRKGLPSSLSCTATLREAKLVWRSGGKDYVVDKNGVAFRENTQQLPGPIIEDRSNVPLKIGTSVASTSVVDQVLTLEHLLTERKIRLKNFFVEDSLYQFGAVLSEFNDKNNQPIQKEITALFVTTQPLEAQVQSLGAILKERGQSINERVDLRIPGYVYYK